MKALHGLVRITGSPMVSPSDSDFHHSSAASAYGVPMITEWHDQEEDP